MIGMTPKSTALAGIRILDAGIVQAGPFSTRLLADWGAEVIRVEAWSRPDGSRISVIPNSTPGPVYWEQGGIHHEQHRNKLGVTLELTHPKGVEMFKRLVKISDVVLESYPPRVMKNFGLDYAELVKVNPGIIVLSSCGYGHGGPMSDTRSYGTSTQAMAGITSLMGYAGDVPLHGATPYTDHPSTYHGAFSIMAALEYRRRTGKGQWIDFAQYEVGVNSIAPAVVGYQMNGAIPQRDGNRSPGLTLQGVYPCAGEDRWVVIMVEGDAPWAALCAEMGDPEWTRDPRLAGAVGRREHQDMVDAGIAAWTADQDHYAVAHRLQAAGVPAGPVLSNKGVLLDPHLNARGFWQLVEHRPEAENVGKRPFPSSPAKMSKTPGGVHRPAPLLGEHHEEIFGGLMGLTGEEIAGLEADKVISTVPIWAGEPPRPSLAPDPRRRLAAGLIKEWDADPLAALGITQPVEPPE